ncbi:MAG: PH domain-containing protein [Phycisphaerae bacterium]
MNNDDPIRTDHDLAPLDDAPRSFNTTESEGASLAEAAGDGTALDEAAETEIWVGRTHWKHYVGRLAVWLCGNIVFAILVIWLTRRIEWLTFSRAFTGVVIVFVISGLEFVVRRVLLKIVDHRYRVTTQRLFIERGILSQTVDQTELIRVDDVRIHKSFLGRVFGLGSVAIVSTDATDRDVVIEGIAEPEKVAEAIRTRMRMMRKKSLFIENL